MVKGCHRYELWTSAYWDGELDSGKSRDLFLHLSGCPDCSGTFHKMERLHASLSAGFPPVAPDANLPELVMAALSREPYRPTRQGFLRRILPPQRPVKVAYGWAAVAMASLGAFTLGLKPWSGAGDPPSSPRFARASAPKSESLPRSVSRRAEGSELTPSATPLNASTSEKGVPVKASASGERVKAVPSDTARPVKASESSEQARKQPVPPAVKAVAIRALTVKPAETHAPSIPAQSRTSKPQNPPSQVNGAARESAFQTAAYTGGPARLRQVAGVAETRSDEDIDWTNIPLDAPVRMDQRVRSGSDSRIALALGGGLEIRMNEDTEIVPVRTPQPGSPFWVVQLVKGELFARVPKGPFGLKVMTAGNVATAKEGEVIVKTNDLYETRLLIARGSATLENDLGRTPGSGGMQISSRMGITPDPALPSLDLQTEFRWAYAPIARDEHQTQRPG